MKILFYGFLLIVAETFSDEVVRYDEHSLVKVTPTIDQFDRFFEAVEGLSESGYKFLTQVTNGEAVNILVPPHLKNYIKNRTRSINADYEILIENVQQRIEEEEQKNRNNPGNFGWDNYHGLEEINQWLTDLQSQYADKMTLIEGGSSYENRTILGVKISFSKDNENNAVFIEANSHAREWITSAVATYLINELMTSEDLEFRNITEKFDWYIFPVVNPDGFNFSHTYDRMWFKTRTPYENSCFGANTNYNWGYEWRNQTRYLPCEDHFPGPSPFSEDSTRSLSEYIDSVAKNLQVYLSFQSVGSFILVPYGYTIEPLDNFNEAFGVATKAAKAIKVRYGHAYQTGSINSGLGTIYGTSIDYVKGTHGVPFALLYKLRDDGYLISSSEIIPSGEEIIDSLVALLTAVENRNKNGII